MMCGVYNNKIWGGGYLNFGAWFLKYIKWIVRGVFLHAFTHANTGLKGQNGSLVSRVWTASNYTKVHFSSWLLWMWGRHWIPNSMNF